MASLEVGKVQIYTGDGKGKTTAALGLAMRATGYGLNVLMLQFERSCTAPSTTPRRAWGCALYRPTVTRPRLVPSRSWSWRASRLARSTC